MTTEEYINIRFYLMETLLETEFFGKVYCVGGCVRDYVRGIPPNDIDLVVGIKDGGVKLARYLWKLGVLDSTPVIYERYGTVQFKLSKFPTYEIEAVQMRSEKYIDKESRNPLTEYGSLEDDWKRRDFTINALYHNLWLDEITDPSEKGVKDIKDGIIRTTSDPGVIFSDDPLRILRAIRFASCSGYVIESDCFSKLCKNSFRLEIISKERIVSEVTKILTSPNPKFGLHLLELSHSLCWISLHLETATKIEQNKYHVGTVWEHTLEVIDKLRDKDKITLWAALFHDIGKITTKTVGENGKISFIGHAVEGAHITADILKSLRFSTTEIEEISDLVRYHMDFKGDLRPKDKKLRKLQLLLGRDQYIRLWNLIEADNMSHAPGYCIEGQRDYVFSRPMDMFDYKLPVTGRDIMEVRKIKSGPLVAKYLDHLYKLAYVNPKLTKEDMLKRLRNLSPSKLGGKENGQK